MSDPRLAALPDGPFARLLALLKDVEPGKDAVLNLLSVAGEWGSFDRDWLCARLRLKRSAWNPRVWLARRMLRSYARTQWQRLDEIIVRLRSSRTAS